VTERAAARLSAGGIAALRYAGQRQLTRWGARELSPRNEQRRAELTAALTALRQLEHRGWDCERRPRPPGT
jgi:hypothetical protein